MSKPRYNFLVTRKATAFGKDTTQFFVRRLHTCGAAVFSDDIASGKRHACLTEAEQSIRSINEYYGINLNLFTTAVESEVQP